VESILPPHRRDVSLNSLWDAAPSED